MPRDAVRQFDEWIRSAFKVHNTELENIYFAQDNPAVVEGVGDDIKARLRDQGLKLIADIVADNDWFGGEAEAYDLLGNVGFFLAALRRHELTNPDREQRSPFPEASALAQTLSTRLGVAPRFATAHVNLSNHADRGVHKSFTNLKDELTFIKYNCLSILGYIRAADVLRRIIPLGVTHPVAEDLFAAAKAALEDVCRSNAQLDEQLDVRRFFFNIRPYFKPYRVGRNEYRGANAGDFAAINEVDLMLGVCRVADPTYSALIIEKLPFVTLDDQRLLQSSARQRSLLDEFILLLDDGGRVPEPAVAPLRMFIETCEAHGETASQHHDRFVRRYIEEPAVNMAETHLKQITASGPPLSIVVGALNVLRDKRRSANRTDIDTRYADLQQLRRAAGLPPT
ncbi:DUF1864 family protein [Ensifer sp. ENS05]|uniref:monodechloroaminopyrrolnitrin synthase PrnB family protein n=1 Tax=Ensifer sp. ENS05 TaxID=2769277 RepID=UPI001783D738|nr:monodechloroaminopyrrolnitrin synthase PrnB family protein [Ensifer sp. ENS05]MBD9597404.1 DUF1864 family protein [Ensifer sp. ENS05]